MSCRSTTGCPVPDQPLAQGTEIAGGHTGARMMRQLERSIGVVFLTPLDPRRVDEDIVQ